MKGNQNKIDFKAYYESLRKIQTSTRDLICEKLGISVETFYYKMRNDSFDRPEQIVIAQVLGQSVNVLFPKQKVA